MRRIRIERKLVVQGCLLIGLALGFSVGAARGVEVEPTPVQKLDQAMASLANTIQARLQDQGETQIRMGTFDGPDGGSQRMMKSLKDELTKRGLVVTDKAGWKVSAEYFLDTEGGSDLATLMIEAKVKQPGGRTATEIRYVIGNETEMAQALGSTFEPSQPPPGAAGAPPATPGGASWNAARNARRSARDSRNTAARDARRRSASDSWRPARRGAANSRSAEAQGSSRASGEHPAVCVDRTVGHFGPARQPIPGGVAREEGPPGPAPRE